MPAPGSSPGSSPTWLEPGRGVHLVGIGGMGMAGLARILRERGLSVTGSDAAESPRTRSLGALGVPVEIGPGGEVPADAAAVVASAAVPGAHPGLEEAGRRGLPVLKYARALAAAVRGRRIVAVAGTHGKTTTTAWIAHLLRCAGRDPGWLVGGEPLDLPASAGLGSDPLFVLEACEFDRSFLSFEPALAVVTNVEADHLDFYGTEGALREAFGSFLALVREGGAAILCADDPAARALPVPAGVRRITYGLGEDADVSGIAGPGGVSLRDAGAPPFCVRVPGRHNARNALAVLAAARALGVPGEAAWEALATFRGVGRRFEILGEAGGVVWVNDYGHHPSEIAAAADAARERFPGRRLLALFQPHQRHRTVALFDGFAEALAPFHRAAVAEIYGAREEVPTDGSLEAHLASAAVARGCGAAVHRRGMGAAAWIRGEACAGDVVLVLGAGDLGDRPEEIRAAAGIRAPGPAEARG